MDTARGSVPMNVCGPSSWQVEAGGSGVQGHALAHSELEVNLFKKRSGERRGSGAGGTAEIQCITGSPVKEKAG